jgi:hypothetical protein
MKFTRILILPIIFLTMALCVSAQNGNGKGKPSPSPTASPSPTPAPVVISVRFVYCVAGDTACETANRVRQDVDRPYVNGSEGVAISWNVGVSGDLTINLLNSQRSAIYDYRDRVHDGNPTPSFVNSPQTLKLFFNALKAHRAKENATCVDGICEGIYEGAMNGGGYTINKVTYRTQWNPGSAQPYINFVEPTSPVNVHYYKDATGETWTITPIQKSNGYYLAGLQGEKQPNTVTFGGQYNMPFALVVTVR